MLGPAVLQRNFKEEVKTVAVADINIHVGVTCLSNYSELFSS